MSAARRTGMIIGAGAQGRIISETWRLQDPEVVLQFVDDDAALHGTALLGVPIVGGTDGIEAVNWDETEAVLAVGNNLRRLELAQRWESIARWACVTHPRATVMPSASIGEGTTIFAHAVINSGARLGRHVVINTSAVIEHDAVLEDGCAIGPGTCMGGRVEIGRGAFISTGVVIAPRLRIGEGAVIGAGATVVEDVPPGVLAYGVPARVIRPLRGPSEYARLM